jgi:membrane protein DedA with SNARE-associated domain
VSLPAGLARFRFLPFVVLTTIGSAVWNAVLIGLGWALDDAWHNVEERMSGLTVLVVAVAVVAAAVWLVVARRRGRRRPAAES